MARNEKAGKEFVARMTHIEPRMQMLMLIVDNVPLILSKRQLKTV